MTISKNMQEYEVNTWTNLACYTFTLHCMFLWTSCQNTTIKKSTINTTTVSEIQGTLKQILYTVFDNNEKLNLEKAFTSFWNDSSFSFISNGIKSNYNELKKAEQEYFSLLRQQRFNFSYQHFEVINQDNAIAELAGTMTAVQRDGVIQTKYC